MKHFFSLMAIAILFYSGAANAASAATAQGMVDPTEVSVSTYVGRTVTTSFTIYNTGTVSFVPLSAFTSDYGFFTINMDELHQTIEPGRGNSITVTYAPTLPGEHHAQYSVNIGGSYYSVNFTGTAQVLTGDVGHDGEISLDDVIALIDVLLWDDDIPEGSDFNGDGVVDIDDVTDLLDFLLWLPAETPSEEFKTETFTVEGVSFTMIAVEGGTFMMGATDEQGSDAMDDEKPAHQVTLSSYHIGETEVTQALWVAVMGSNPSRFQNNPERPVENVSWVDCQTFITKLNEMTGKSFRLPSEAEWEFAARGGTLGHGYKYSGSDNPEDVAWYWQSIPSQSSGSDGYGTQPVGTKMPNELGIYDMSGNVYEWCQDYFSYYSSLAQTDPTGPANGTYCIYRGGVWDNGMRACRVSKREYFYPTGAWGNSYPGIGLRIAL